MPRRKHIHAGELTQPARPSVGQRAATPDITAELSPDGLTSRATPTTSPPDVARQRLTTILLLAYGVIFTQLVISLAEPRLLDPAFYFGWRRWVAIAACAAVLLIPPVRSQLQELARRVSNPNPRQRCWAAVAIAMISAAYLVLTAIAQGRDLFPILHDDQSYRLQMQMLASGRLWMASHPLADFFDTFQVLARPVYASAYFPGASLLYLPTVWLDWPSWVMPALVSGGCMGLAYRLVAEAVDGVTGLMVSVAMLTSSVFRFFSLLLTSHHPALFLGLILTWTYFRWRRSGGRLVWALSMGVASGWAVITRPIDALCFLLPVWVCVHFDQRRGQTSFDTERTNRPSQFKTWAFLLLGTAPFLGLQAVFDRGVTGHWLKTPFGLYIEQDQPQTGYGFATPDPTAGPISTIAQKKDYYTAVCRPTVFRHQPSEVVSRFFSLKLPMFFDYVLPSFLLLPLAVVGLARARRDRKLVTLTAVAPLFVLLYFGYSFFLPHYYSLAMPAMLTLSALGLRTVINLFYRRAEVVWPAVALIWLVACLLLLPEWNAMLPLHEQVSDRLIDTVSLRAFRQAVANEVRPQGQAIVLCRYQLGDSVHLEPVYNYETASPDDAKVVVAHDLGAERNQELYRYYAERQPDRKVFQWDRHLRRMQSLGPVVGLVKPPPLKAAP